MNQPPNAQPPRGGFAALDPRYLADTDILCPPFVVQQGRSAFAHQCGGPPRLANPLCPFCANPLAQYVLLDAGDKPLNLEFLGVDLVPLVYCLRCVLLENVFAYKLIPGDFPTLEHIPIGLMPDDFKGESFDEYEESWKNEIGREMLEAFSVRLQAMPLLFERLSCNEVDELTPAELSFINRASGYDDPRRISQVGGRPFGLYTTPISRSEIWPEDSAASLPLLAKLSNHAGRPRTMYDGMSLVFCISIPDKVIAVTNTYD